MKWIKIRKRKVWLILSVVEECKNKIPGEDEIDNICVSISKLIIQNYGIKIPK